MGKSLAERLFRATRPRQNMSVFQWKWEEIDSLRCGTIPPEILDKIIYGSLNEARLANEQLKGPEVDRSLSWEYIIDARMGAGEKS